MFCIGHQLLIGHARGEITAKHIGRDRGGIVHVGKIGDLEVDFVVEKPDGTEYYQVAASVRAPSTMERELAPFSKIRDHHPKFLLPWTRIHLTTSTASAS